MQSRDDRITTASPQFRALANSLILCRVSDNNVSVCEILARQALCQIVIGNSRQRFLACINDLTELHKDVAVMNVERTAFGLAQFGA